MGTRSRPEHEEASPPREPPSAEAARPVPCSTHAVLELQRTAGNHAVSRMLARDTASLISTGQLAANWRRARDAQPWAPTQPGTYFRLPPAAEIKAMMAAGEVPEAKIKDSVATALTRMQHDKKLSTTDAVPDIMKRLFPAPKTFDEAEFAKVVDVADRTKIYEKAADAEAKLTAADKVTLIALIGRAKTMLTTASADAAKIKLVFGTRAADAQKIYVAAHKALTDIEPKIDTNVHTDYNRDDPEVSLGGWARFSSQTMHLSPRTLVGMAPDDAALVIVHEGSHLADPTVKDHGYYPKAAGTGWEGMADNIKVANAAHFEEVPRRHAGKSVFADAQEFKPGAVAGGAAITFEQQVRLDARDRLRKAWDTAVTVHKGLRGIRVEIEGGSKARFVANEARILEISRVAKLTIHDQTPKPHTINTLDLTLTEGVARAMKLIQTFLDAQTVPAAPVAPKVHQDYVEATVAGATKDYGALTGNAADDKALIDWMFTNYKKVGLT